MGDILGGMTMFQVGFSPGEGILQGFPGTHRHDLLHSPLNQVPAQAQGGLEPEAVAGHSFVTSPRLPYPLTLQLQRHLPPWARQTLRELFPMVLEKLKIYFS